MPQRKRVTVDGLDQLRRHLEPHEMIWLAQEITEREETAQFIRRTYPTPVAAKINAILNMTPLRRAALARHLADNLHAAARRKKPLKKKTH